MSDAVQEVLDRLKALLRGMKFVESWDASGPNVTSTSFMLEHLPSGEKIVVEIHHYKH